jgi:hypothetical protein
MNESDLVGKPKFFLPSKGVLNKAWGTKSTIGQRGIAQHICEVA